MSSLHRAREGNADALAEGFAANAVDAVSDGANDGPRIGLGERGDGEELGSGQLGCVCS